jgi:hypothetical protein
METSKTLCWPSNFPWAYKCISLNFMDNLDKRPQEVSPALDYVIPATSNMDGSCEYIEEVVVDRRQVVVLRFGGWASYEQFLILKIVFVTKHEHLPRPWTDTLVRISNEKRDMRFGIWNVRSQ